MNQEDEPLTQVDRVSYAVDMLQELRELVHDVSSAALDTALASAHAAAARELQVLASRTG